jgi:hypothetical protein
MSTSSPNDAAKESQPLLALPETPSSDATQKLEVGTTVKLDHLGPMVVNQDGTLSRISNWETMGEMEKKNTVRIIGKRNKQRLEALRLKDAEEGKVEEGA